MHRQMTSGLVFGMTEKGALFAVFQRSMNALLPIVGTYERYTARDLEPLFRIWFQGLSQLLARNGLIPHVIQHDWHQRFLICLKREDKQLWEENQSLWLATHYLTDEAKWMLAWSKMFLQGFYEAHLSESSRSQDALLACLVEVALFAITDLFLERSAVFLPAYVEPEFCVRQKQWRKAERRLIKAGVASECVSGTVH